MPDQAGRECRTLTTRVIHMTTVPETIRAFLCGHVRYLRAHGFDAHTLSSPGEDLRVYLGPEVRHHEVRMARGLTPARDLVSLTRLAIVLRRLRPHIVHAHTPKAGYLGMLAARCVGVPVRIYHLHGLRYSTAPALTRCLVRNAETTTWGLRIVSCVSALRFESKPWRTVSVLRTRSWCRRGVALPAWTPRHGSAPQRTRRTRVHVSALRSASRRTLR